MAFGFDKRGGGDGGVRCGIWGLVREGGDGGVRGVRCGIGG